MEKFQWLKEIAGTSALGIAIGSGGFLGVRLAKLTERYLQTKLLHLPRGGVFIPPGPNAKPMTARDQLKEEREFASPNTIERARQEEEFQAFARSRK